MDNNNKPKRKGTFGRILLAIFGIAIILAGVIVFMYFVTPNYFDILPYSEVLAKPIVYVQNLF